VTVTWQNLADGLLLGSVYALMAVGIGLVFGVLRLVNFAYGQLVMAGAFALALASQWGWPAWAGIVLCFAVVLSLSAAMEWVVFRPLRGHSPAVMLVATFAVAFLLQSIALLWFGSLGKIATSLTFLGRFWTIGGVDIRKIAIVAVVVAAVCLLLLSVLLERTEIGLQTPLVTPDFALRDTIVVLAGVVVGGLNRPIPATLGGFAIGFATGVLGGALPTDQSQYLPTFVFVAVILVLLVRPRGLFDFSRTVERV
jgi:branched-chain amino acid transport system permease protein